MTDLPTPDVLGYCDDWSAMAGGTIRFRIGAMTKPRDYTAQLVRIVSSDTVPAGAGSRPRTSMRRSMAVTARCFVRSLRGLSCWSSAATSSRGCRPTR